ncbi:high affinity copper uptake protein 1-like isoform X2 [Watersipora subatra]|uniref:high affinity copper uptake protein 1-like isoform X2 n=1 Tax=Watersipora subatra TaxID=2589382 RepID=UPI00355BF90A
MADLFLIHPMYFTTDWKGSYLLFQSWQLNETWQLALACVFLAIATALYEGLKVLRETLLVWSMKSGASGSSYNTSKTRGSSIRARMCTCHHLLQSVLHVIQVTLSYFLMLAVMTFNVYIGLSIVLGAGVGYFLFGWKRAIVNDVNEHCH